MIITLSVLLIPYALLVFLFFVFAIIHVWHIVKLSALDSVSVFMLAFFAVSTAVILLVTARFAVEIDWDTILFVL